MQKMNANYDGSCFTEAKERYLRFANAYAEQDRLGDGADEAEFDRVIAGVVKATDALAALAVANLADLLMKVEAITEHGDWNKQAPFVIRDLQALIDLTG